MPVRELSAPLLNKPHFQSSSKRGVRSPPDSSQPKGGQEPVAPLAPGTCGPGESDATPLQLGAGSGMPVGWRVELSLLRAVLGGWI